MFVTDNPRSPREDRRLIGNIRRQRDRYSPLKEALRQHNAAALALCCRAGMAFLSLEVPFFLAIAWLQRPYLLESREWSVGAPRFSLL
jgi:hypothetical protein